MGKEVFIGLSLLSAVNLIHNSKECKETSVWSLCKKIFQTCIGDVSKVIKQNLVKSQMLAS